MKIDLTKLRSDLMGDKQEIFKHEFPELEKEIAQLLKQPNCSTCIKAFSDKIFALNTFEQKMKLIYGNDIEIEKPKPREEKPANNNGKKPIENKWKQKPVLLRVALADYDEWFKEYFKDSAKKQTKFYSTFLDTTTLEVVVSMVVIFQE